MNIFASTVYRIKLKYNLIKKFISACISIFDKHVCESNIVSN